MSIALCSGCILWHNGLAFLDSGDNASPSGPSSRLLGLLCRFLVIRIFSFFPDVLCTFADKHAEENTAEQSPSASPAYARTTTESSYRQIKYDQKVLTSCKARIGAKICSLPCGIVSSLINPPRLPLRDSLDPRRDDTGTEIAEEPPSSGVSGRDGPGAPFDWDHIKILPDRDEDADIEVVTHVAV